MVWGNYPPRWLAIFQKTTILCAPTLGVSARKSVRFVAPPHHYTNSRPCTVDVATEPANLERASDMLNTSTF